MNYHLSTYTNPVYPFPAIQATRLPTNLSTYQLVYHHHLQSCLPIPGNSSNLSTYQLVYHHHLQSCLLPNYVYTYFHPSSFTYTSAMKSNMSNLCLTIFPHVLIVLTLCLPYVCVCVCVLMCPLRLPDGNLEVSIRSPLGPH